MSALTTKIPIRRNGKVISEKEVATYAGLLAKAHEEVELPRLSGHPTAFAEEESHAKEPPPVHSRIP